MFKEPLRLSAPPRKIISLVPSQTELLYTLGLEEEVAGITKFCVHPDEWFREKQRIGGTKDVKIEKVIALSPDLIIANKEENVKEQVEALAERFPVLVTDVNDLADAIEMIRTIGRVTFREKEAAVLTADISGRFAAIEYLQHNPLSTAYFIWKDPYMTAGGDTFIHAMLQKAGFSNAFGGELRYPEISIEALRQKAPEVLLLSSEPYPFKDKHITELRQYLPAAKILLADGEMFSWYGSRLLQAPAYFRTLNEQVRAIAL